MNDSIVIDGEDYSRQELRAAVNMYRDIAERRNKRRKHWYTVLNALFMGCISSLFPLILYVFCFRLTEYEISEDFWTGAVSAAGFLIAWAVLFTLFWKGSESSRV